MSNGDAVKAGPGGAGEVGGKPTARLRRLIGGPKAVLVPGCYDALGARILEQAGFPAIYMSGSAVTASLLGYPDIGLVSFHEMVEQARRIALAVDVPVISDADTGYGNAVNVWRTVREFEAAGVAGIHLEDQELPKRCGHFEGKRLIPAAEMAKKLEAALAARRDDDFIIIARTDARAVEGMEGALKRARLYRSVGVDMLFVEALTSVDEMKRLNEAFAGFPLLVNVVEGGKTPQLSLAAYEELGYRVVLYPTASVRAAMKAFRELARELREKGSTEGFLHRLVGFGERNEITGLAAFDAWERRFAIEETEHGAG